MNVANSLYDLLEEKSSNGFPEVTTFRYILIELSSLSEFLHDHIHHLLRLAVMIENLSFRDKLYNFNNIGMGL